MIYFTGDTHGGIDMSRFTTKNMRKANVSFTDKDYCIICGDFGFPFLPSDTVRNSPTNGEYRFWTKFLSRLPCKILFVDGNHDNHAFWKEQTVNQWHGGKVHFHPDIPNAIHLMRGEVYSDVDGKTIFAFGGAASRDIEPVYDETGFCTWNGRKEGKNWWKEEVASDEEIASAISNLQKVDNRVDIVVTHTPPRTIARRVYETEDRTADFLDDIKIDYNIWVSGHLHFEWYDQTRKMLGTYKSIRSYNEAIALIQTKERKTAV